jgi:GTP pyrophosphokinase
MLYVVSVIERPAVSGTVPDLGAWFAAYAADRPSAEAALLERAHAFARAAHTGQARASGEPHLHHVLEVAYILAGLNLDAETIAAALLHDTVEDTATTLDDVRQAFGARVAALVDGVTKMDVIHALPARGEQVQAESLRKMLLAMAEDVRVVLIKLADRLHNMRTLGHLPEDKQRRIARETLDIFAPLANRLGIWQIKWELEDLAFRYLEPATYKQIAGLLAEKRVDREHYIEQFVARLAAELKAAGIGKADDSRDDAMDGEGRATSGAVAGGGGRTPSGTGVDISGRPKHIYGIWRKMSRKGKPFEQIADLRGVRVLVESVRDCYGALGVVHGLWPHLPGEFDDYIATPKENHYRSIHTAVIGPEGKVVEVQIRTHDMHEASELGIAAHWRYKEGARADEGFDRKVAWLRSLLEWKDEVAGAADFVDRFKSEVFSERVYVLTPKGRILDLPTGATVLDFAYHVHTDVGHRCRGAKVNGHMVPLTTVLKTGEQVEIVTVKEGGPSRDWLSPHLGYLATSRARAKVAHWFREQGHDAAAAAGREALARELDRLGVRDVGFETLAQHLGFAGTDALFAAFGRGEVRPTQLANAVQAQIEPLLPDAPRPAAPAPAAPAGVTVQGVGNLLTRLARCCHPLPGEPIVGFITRGQGVTVHRRDCPNALRHRDEHGERLIEVSWGERAGRTYPVDVEITAYDRAGLLRDITGLLANEKVNVHGVSTHHDRQQVAHLRFTLEIPDLDTLSRVLALLDQVPNVVAVRRRGR